MREYSSARKKMVRRQLAARGIKDRRVLEAMEEVPRHLFLDPSLRDEAYDDNPLPIGDGQTISQPYMVARMTELLDPQGDQKVLEIGTGSGYQAAILSRLCSQVCTVERNGRLVEKAKRVLQECGYENIAFLLGDGTKGWPEEAPFARIMITAGAPRIPQILVDQLADGGRLVIPVGDRNSQTLKLLIKTGPRTIVEDHTGCRFVDLIGEYGWSEF
jgi:protein-L-isoaspartate(D-aspartate) O-methyltransferase